MIRKSDMKVMVTGVKDENNFGVRFAMVREQGRPCARCAARAPRGPRSPPPRRTTMARALTNLGPRKILKRKKAKFPENFSKTGAP